MSYGDIKEALKDARNFSTGAYDNQLKEKLSEITIQVYDLLDENRNLREKINEMENENILDAELEPIGHFLYKGENDQPYCMSCWDKDRKLIRCIVTDMMSIPIVKCLACNFSSDNFKNS